MEPIRAVVHGALGRMGREVAAALCGEAATVMVGAVDIGPPADTFELPDGTGRVPLSGDVAAMLDSVKPDVLVDFTIAPAAMPAVRAAAASGVNLVTGTTGLSEAEFDEIDRLAADAGIGVVAAPNFALGAVLMTHLAAIAARYLDHAEIVELHHDRKVDAPSGTALLTAREMARARGRPFLRPAKDDQRQESRGQIVEGINLHAVRMPGLSAHQEVIFGALGQTLSIRHDTVGRDSYMPGVLLAIKEVVTRKGLVRGLPALLGLE
jgi:4-hydroxy-tetrahydrodipicolinate reductase